MGRRTLTDRTLRLTAAECRAVDRHAIERLGIPGLVLMENAGRGAADLIERRAVRAGRGSGHAPRISIVCGRGNNGGDGFVIARHLSLRGFDVAVDLLGEPADLSPDAAVNHQVIRNMGVPLRALSTTPQRSAATRRWKRGIILVDALLGTGFAGLVREPLGDVIRRINRLTGPRIVSVDVPSGLNADTGEPGGVAVRAHETVTFLAAKVGFARACARAFVGRVTVVGIGAPLEADEPHDRR